MQLRTNLFHFDPGLLAPVYQLRSTPEYRHAWRSIRKASSKNLPTDSLEQMLALLSGGPVWVNPYADDNPDAPAIAMLKSLPHHRVCKVIELWSRSVNEQVSELDVDVHKRLVPAEASDLYADSLMGAGKVTTPAYAVIPWMVTREMALQTMESSIPLDLTQCSDSTLLAWDRPITYQYRARVAWAMHAVNARLLLLHRRPMPYIAINVHLSHLLPEWRHTTKSAWLRTATGISKLAIHTLPKKDDCYRTVYTSRAPGLLEQMGHEPFPTLGGDSISMDSLLRPIHSHVPAGWPVGSGAGPLFLDQACFHLLKTVAGTRPMLATRIVGQLRAQKQPRTATPEPLIKAAVVTAHTDVMSRVLLASEQLANVSKVFAELAVPPLDIRQVACPGAFEALCTSTNAADVEMWFRNQLLPRLQALQPNVAVIETCAEAARKPEADPKHILRTLCAQHRIATQFLVHIPEPDVDQQSTADYAAINGLVDALRCTGYLPSPLPQAPGIPGDMTVVCAYLEEIRSKSAAKFLPVLTRTRVGDRQIEVFWQDVDNEGVPRWFSYQEGLCRIHATARLMTKAEAQQLFSQALLAPTPIADTPLLIMLHARLKTLYAGLNDGPGEGLPPIPKHACIVRIRADDQTAQMSGNHTKSPCAAEYIGNRIGVYQAADHDRLHYFVSYSKQYNRVISQRKNTRYDIHAARLKDPWQQLGVTESVVLQDGNFATAAQVAKQIGIWCRDAPLWDGYLRLPSPLHAAKQIALDHPVIERQRRSL